MPVVAVRSCNGCGCHCARYVLALRLQARASQIQGNMAAAVADAPIRINLPHGVRCIGATKSPFLHCAR
jgi:hypothetical protein